MNGTVIVHQKKDDVLSHAGTKGQKWGVRLWQNEDGSYNDAGRERYNAMRRKTNSMEERIKKLEDENRQREYSDLNDRLSKLEKQGSQKNNSDDKAEKEAKEAKDKAEKEAKEAKDKAEKEQREYQERVKGTVNNTVGLIEKYGVKSISDKFSAQEAAQLRVENAPNEYRIDHMSTEDIKAEVEHIKQANSLKELTNKKVSVNHERNQKILAMIGGTLAMAKVIPDVYFIMQKIKSQSVQQSALNDGSDYLAHYGRKGMKRGMSIFQEDYDPIGQIAQGPEETPKSIRRQTRQDNRIYRAQQASRRSKQAEQFKAQQQMRVQKMKQAAERQKTQNKYDMDSTRRQVKMQYEEDMKRADAQRELQRQQNDFEQQEAQDQYEAEKKINTDVRDEEVARKEEASRNDFRRKVIGGALVAAGAVAIGVALKNAGVIGGNKVGKAAKAIDNASDAAKAAKTADKVSDAAKAAKTADKVSDAAKAAKTADKVSDAALVAKTADKVPDAAKAAKVADKALDPDEIWMPPKTKTETKKTPKQSETIWATFEDHTDDPVFNNDMVINAGKTPISGLLGSASKTETPKVEAPKVETSTKPKSLADSVSEVKKNRRHSGRNDELRRKVNNGESVLQKPNGQLSEEQFRKAAVDADNVKYKDFNDSQDALADWRKTIAKSRAYDDMLNKKYAGNPFGATEEEEAMRRQLSDEWDAAHQKFSDAFKKYRGSSDTAEAATQRFLNVRNTNAGSKNTLRIDPEKLKRVRAHYGK